MQRLNFPAFYYEGATHPVIYNEQMVCMNASTWSKMVPLLEYQEYIHKCIIWEGQEFEIDFDLSRDRRYIPMPNGDIYTWPWFIYHELICDLSKKWVNAPKDDLYIDKIIINRTERYQNPYISYFFLKDYEKSTIFVGMEKEYDIFCKKFKLKIPLLNVDNFLQLSTIINSCKIFLGNQSFCWHLSNAMKVKRILEMCPQFPNCVPYGEGGHMFLYQEKLESIFKKIIY